MWLAHHFPGLHLRPEDADQLTPEETAAMVKAGKKILKGEADERWAHTRIIAMSSGARIRGL